MGESGWGEASGAGGGSNPEAGARTAGRARRCLGAPQPCGRRRRAREREGGSEPRRPAARGSDHRSPHPAPQTLPVPPRAPRWNPAPAPKTIVPAHLTPLPGARRGRRRRGAPASRGARGPAGRG